MGVLIFQNYLEIGVNEGETFEKIIAPLKHAVDIQFKYNFDETNALFDKFRSVIRFEKHQNFSRIAK